ATAPTSPPTRAAVAASRAAAGKAAPRSVVGTSRTATEATANRATTSTVSLPVSLIAHMPTKTCASGSHVPSRATTTMELAPAPAISSPNRRQGSWPGRDRRAEKAAPEAEALRHGARITAKGGVGGAGKEKPRERRGPPALIAERHAPRRCVESEGDTGVARAGGGRGLPRHGRWQRSHAAIEDQRGGRDGEADRAREDARAGDAER